MNICKRYGVITSTAGARMPSRPARTRVGEAQDAMCEVWDAEGARRVQLSCQALEISCLAMAQLSA